MTPLWVIASFVSLTEIVIGAAATQTTGEIQSLFTKFAIGFPCGIASAFFLVLWTKPYVLYSPTEFGPSQDVEKFVDAMKGLKRNSEIDTLSVEEERGVSTGVNATESKPKVETNKPQDDSRETDPAQPELQLDHRTRVDFYFFLGDLEKAKKTFEELQAATKDPELKIEHEAYYLRNSFEKGDETALKSLHQLELRTKEFPTKVGLIKRMQGYCYMFSRTYNCAFECFSEASKLCVTAAGRAESACLAASALYKQDQKPEAFNFLRQHCETSNDETAKVELYRGLAGLYELDGNKLAKCLALLRALSFRPNSKI